MLSSAGKAVHPALTATANGESIDNPMRAQASLANKSAISCHKALKMNFTFYQSSPWKTWIKMLVLKLHYYGVAQSHYRVQQVRVGRISNTGSCIHYGTHQVLNLK